MFKLVTLDVRGTLLKLKKPIGEIYSDVGKMYGINADSELLNSCFNKTFVSMNESHINFGVSSGLGWENWWKQLVLRTFQCALNRNELDFFTNRNLQLVSDKLIEMFNTRECWSLEDGSIEFLNYMKKLHIHMGVVSNFDPRLSNILKDMNIHNYFSFILTSYECQYPKPDIRIFHKAKDMFENNTQDAFDSSSTLHIGDSVKFDYHGAKNAGWKAALISSNNSISTSNNVDHKFVFKNLSDLQTNIFQKN